MAKRDKKPDPLPYPSDPGAALFLELMMQMLAFFILLTSYAVIVEEKRLNILGKKETVLNDVVIDGEEKGDEDYLKALW